MKNIIYTPLLLERIYARGRTNNNKIKYKIL